MKICIALLIALVLAVSTVAQAEMIVLTGTLNKKTDDIFHMSSGGKTYLLSTNFKSLQRKTITLAAKKKAELTVVGEVDKVKAGPEAGKVLLTPDGMTVFQVKVALTPGASGFEEGTFDALQCGDACYCSIIDAKGKPQTYFANGEMPSFDQILDNAALKGKRVRVYWEKLKKDRIAMYLQFFK